MRGSARRHTELICKAVTLAVACGLGAGPAVSAEVTPPISLQAAAEVLGRSTVTVRVRNPDLDESLPQAAADSAILHEESQEEAENPPSTERVMVCSGIAVSPRFLISPIYAGSDSEIRITLVGGDSSTVRLRALDGYSGLALLESEEAMLSPIRLAEAVPAVGNWILSAAAWGAEQPAVSFGILGASERTLADSHYPPMLQCDLRTAETSSGAGVVDREGRLIGIVVAEDRGANRRGWTYAVPVNHVRRLLNLVRAQQDHRGVLIVKRRRPTVGMVLDSTDAGVVVVRVHAGSPADKAGIAVGDCVRACDGVQIRSVYQAVRPILFKQPGDRVRFRLERDGDVRELEVVLAGGVELPSASLATLGQWLQPKLRIESMGEGRYAAHSEHAAAREFLGPDASTAADEHGPRPATATEKIQLMQEAAERYQRAIVFLQSRLEDEQQQRARTESLIQDLHQQIRTLQSRLESAAEEPPRSTP